jgi:glycosyltransferase involved in cell wall biosynthesis
LLRPKRFKGWVELRLAVVSPFLNRQHGTELCIIEQIERFASQEHWKIELYSQEVSQLNGVRPASEVSRNSTDCILWHKVSGIAGPHLLKYLWWFFANQWQRWRDRRSGRVRADLVYSPGINCLDADVIAVHIVFYVFYERVRPRLALHGIPLGSWPRVIHRRLYYKLIVFLEQKIYCNPRVRLVAVSSLVAAQLKAHYQREDVAVIPNAVDTLRFTPEARMAKRNASRGSASYDENDFVLLLIGNDWKKKGLDTLLKALAVLMDMPWRLLVVGSDAPDLYRTLLEQIAAPNRVRFAKPSADVLSFYAAADLYAGPSLEDAFNLPILEAMACGLPVIASSQAGASEMIRDGETGFILSDPHDHLRLAQLIRRIYSDQPLRLAIGEAASQHVLADCSWDRNASRTCEVLEAVWARRREI